MIRHTHTKLALLATLLVGLQACSAEPTGQVVAVVNGEEITQAELNAELADLPASVPGDSDTVRRQILQQIVDRRLMAQVAKEEGFDRDPAFLTRERRLKEELLVEMYGQKIAETVSVPDSAAIKKFLADNPGKFKERTAYRVDQIVFDFPGDAKVLKALEADKSLADVERTLNELNIKFVRGSNTLDSRNVPNSALKRILALPPGEPFVIPAQGRVTVSVITGQQPVPTTEQEAAPLAAQQMRVESLTSILQARLDEAKAKAKISYQDDLAPDAASKKPDVAK